MRNASVYARRMKKLYNTLRRQNRKISDDKVLTDSLEQLLLGILSGQTSETRARQALSRIKKAVVDYNELRVTPPGEILALVGPNLSLRQEKAVAIGKVLNAIFDREHAVDLSRLRDEPKRAAREYLAGLEGIDRCTVAGVMLMSLGGHAIPVDDNMMELFRNDELIPEDATAAQVESFLERHIPAGEARAFSVLVRRYAASRTAGHSVKQPSEAKKRKAAARPAGKPSKSVAKRSKGVGERPTAASGQSKSSAAARRGRSKNRQSVSGA